jgi:hypothetical protein
MTSHYIEYDGALIFADHELEVSIIEMAILAPIMVQFTPVERVPFYLSTGIVLGFPFNNKARYSHRYIFDGKTILEDFGEQDEGIRSLVDFGAALGIGAMLTPNLGVDIRYVFNVNDVLGRREKKVNRVSLMYLTLGVSYFL